MSGGEREMPYPNGLPWRMGELERRVGRLEEGAPGTITGDTKADVSEIKSDLRYIKRGIWATFASIVTLIAVLAQALGR